MLYSCLLEVLSTLIIRAIRDHDVGQVLYWLSQRVQTPYNLVLGCGVIITIVQAWGGK